MKTTLLSVLCLFISGMGEYADRISAEFTGNGEKFVGHQ